ncbi:MAG: helix-turn-helix domain-containing protein [Paludibacteraceae bacterium]|nr:helix-turn-helix domain-containing protein [Paludibacteraceae bacterium]
MSFQEEKTISFEQLPQAVATLIEEVKGLKSFLTITKSEQPESDRWFNLQELCEYLPDRPARQTVYGWIGQRLIPYHKKGKKLQFLKSEIDSWLKADKRKSVAELQAEAEQYVNAKKGGVK